MITLRSITRQSIAIALVCVFSMSTQMAQAVPLTLSDEPLFLLTTAKSNMFFLFDNTGSMAAETITKDLTEDNVYTDGLKWNFTAPNDATNQSGNYISISSGGASIKALRAYQYNTLYYNPNNDYEAWPNTNPADCTIDKAIINPAQLGTSGYVKLNANWLSLGTGTTTADDNYAAGYFVWKDKLTDTPAGNDDGIVQNSELTFVPVTTAREQNFANWFCYHRTRLLAAKAAILNAIYTIPANVPLRVGINTFKNDRFIGLKDVTVSNPDPMAVPLDGGLTNRNSLVSSIKPWEFCSSGCASGTRTFSALTRAGDYFKCSTTTTALGGGTSSGASQNCAYNSSVIPSDEQTCSANFAVIVTDGEYRDETGSSAADDTISTADPTFVTAPYQGTTTHTLADLAMSLYNADFQAGIANKIPTICGVDENSAQHLVTYGVSMGLPYDTDILPSRHPKLGYATNCIRDSDAVITGLATGNNWRESSGPTTIQKMNEFVHATYNGRGKFYNAASASELTDSLVSIATDAAARRGAAAAVGLSSTTNTTGTVAYLSTYYSGYWYGALGAYTLSSAGVLSTTSIWSADEKLDATTATARKIATYNPGSGGIAFSWSTTALTAAQQLDLNSSDSKGSLRLDFIRGDHSCEENFTSSCATTDKIFRDRIKSSSSSTYTRLGDLINSAPVYVGTPIGNYPDAAPYPTGTTDKYSSFKSGTLGTTRTPMLYIGGNDGMLHAFTATGTAAGGVEAFAYVPNALSLAGGSKLHALTEKLKHRSYVDLTPTIADAYTTVPGSSTRTWRTILVGGLRHGGKGIYALDVSDPDTVTDNASAASKVMWEFTEDDDATDGDMGYTYSQPAIVPLYVGSGGTVADIAWFAVFGNGYGSASGHAALYLVKLSGPTGTGPGSKWIKDTDYFKIVVGGTDNGLSTPALVALGSDGIYTRAYAGDLKGNMWVFDLSSTAPTTTPWASAFGTTTTPEPLFTTAVPTSSITGSTAGNPQPITTKPVIVRNTASAAAPNVLVLFGTGEYLANGDQNISDVQSFYGIWDKGTNVDTKGTASTADDTSPLTSSNLIEQTITQASVAFASTSSTATVRTLSNSAVDYSAATVFGWYMDFKIAADAKERVVSKANLLGNTLLFSTITPTANACGGGGTSWLMAVNPINGHAPAIPTFNADGGANGVVDTSDNVGGAVVAGVQNAHLTPEYAFVSGDNTAVSGTKPCASGSYVQGIGTSTDASTTSQGICAESGTGQSGRLSWRQLHF